MARTPIHPGEILAEELEGLGVSPTELSRQIRVPANRISQIINGKRAVTGDTALRLAHFRHEPAVLDEPSGALPRARGRAGGRHGDQGASHQARDEGQTRSDATGASSTEAHTCCCTAASRASARWVSRWSWTAR